jgi:hypothetical protein
MFRLMSMSRGQIWYLKVQAAAAGWLRMQESGKVTSRMRLKPIDTLKGSSILPLGLICVRSSMLREPADLAWAVENWSAVNTSHVVGENSITC